MKTIKRRKNEAIDEDVNRSIRRFRAAKLDSGELLIEINTVFYKTVVYSNIKIPRKWDQKKQSANFCDFPTEYGPEYIKQLTAEDMIRSPDGTVSFTKPRHRPNESLDLRVENLACRDYLIDKTVKYLQVEAVKNGASQQMADNINSKTALEWTEKTIGQ